MRFRATDSGLEELPLDLVASFRGSLAERVDDHRRQGLFRALACGRILCGQVMPQPLWCAIKDMRDNRQCLVIHSTAYGRAGALMQCAYVQASLSLSDRVSGGWIGPMAG